MVTDARPPSRHNCAGGFGPDRRICKSYRPCSLNEATDQDINAFLRADVTDVNARSLVARTGAKARISYNQGQIEYAMVRFRKFRNSVLKNLPKDKTQ